jgi:Rrf2 family protein
MKLITRDTDYAIRALSVIAQDKDRMVSAAELVRKLKIPRPFLRKLLQLLNKKKILKSFKGQGGGFTLRVAPKNITIYDLMKIFQGPFTLIEHIFRSKACCNVRRCKLKKRLDTVEEHVVAELRTITLASILEKC